MTREELLSKLYEIKNWKCNGDADLHMTIEAAIKALEQPEPHWIPCSERLPEEDEWVIITYKFLGDDNDIDVSMDRIKDGKWISKFVVAWMPLPSPYQKRGEQE